MCLVTSLTGSLPGLTYLLMLSVYMCTEMLTLDDVTIFVLNRGDQLLDGTEGIHGEAILQLRGYVFREG